MTAAPLVLVEGVNTLAPRYVSVLKAYDDVLIVDLGMHEKHGTVDAYCNGSAIPAPELFFSVEDDASVFGKSLVFSTLIGWEFVMATYHAYTITVVFAKGLYDAKRSN